jgi:SAM-dependent methyltransferase
MNAATIAALEEQRGLTAAAAKRLAEEHGAAIERYRAIVAGAVDDVIARLRRDVDEISGGSPFCANLVEKTAAYFAMMAWVAWDLPQIAVAVRPDPERFRADLAASLPVYFAGRILDDYLDRHFLYRGRRDTLLASLVLERGDGGEAEALTVVTSLLLCFEGLAYARQSEQAALIIESARSLLVGIVMERSPRGEWSPAFYERLVRLKNVDYWRILYAGVDAGLRSPLYPFLCRYYALAQKLNDLQDSARDEEQGRPNITAIHGADAAAIVADDLLDLGRLAAELGEPERCVALTKLGESQEEAARLGLFAAPPPPPAAPEPLRLFWHSDRRDFVARLGLDALEETACGVCGGTATRALFRKQGFHYQRCTNCSHIYVSPRLKPEYQKRLGEELDEGPEDEFMQTQKIYAGYLCSMLRRHAPGPRLLDVGYGAGYLLRTARAHGFQVYGVETSRALTSRLDGILGRRLEVAHLSEAGLPFGSFDAVAMIHVLEHLADPRPVLAAIMESLNPGGVLYVAVPDSESWQFRIFGKEWDAVNPVAHYQFFNEASFTRALRDAGFVSITRMRLPLLKGEMRRRWMNLFRGLGGDESGEVALLAWKVKPPATEIPGR